MQRLFSMFPSGAPGIALLLLRISIALLTLLHVYARHEAMPDWLLIAVAGLSALLVGGAFTPIVALIAAGVQLIGPMNLESVSVTNTAAGILSAIALALLGPGAYSLDAIRFGRRVVDLPQSGDE